MRLGDRPSRVSADVPRPYSDSRERSIAHQPAVLPYELENDLKAKLYHELQERWSADGDRLDVMCAEALWPPGKMLRPLLLVESARAVGGVADSVLPAAAGAECGHAASLVHDDIVDGDELRRGRPALHRTHGVNEAIIAGDALIFDLFAHMVECRDTGVPPSRIVQAVRIVASAGIDLCRGQSLESELGHRRTFDIEEYLTVARLKTAAYFRCVCQTGAALGGAKHHEIEALGVFGENLGCGFQIYDDLLVYTSTTGRTGKPADSDARNGRLTLPVILAHQASGSRGKAQIEDALFGSASAPSRAAVLDEAVRRTEAIPAAMKMARDFSREALAALDVLPDTSAKRRLSAISRVSIDRDS